MGSRVNYVVVRGGRWTRYGQGGGAGDSVDYHFAVGPEVVLAWLANLGGEYVHENWFNDVLSKGGVLLDVDRKLMLLFTTNYDYTERSGMLEAFSRTWPGWEIRWAYDGMGDLVAYVGGDRSQVRDDVQMSVEQPYALGTRTFP